MITFIIIGSLIGFIALLLLISTLLNRISVNRWLRNPPAPGKMVDIGDHRLYCTIKGNGPLTVIVEPGCGIPSAAWWSVQDELSKSARVLTYDRSGYAWSETAKSPRTSEQLVVELRALLDKEGIKGPYIFIGHSFGGLVSVHFSKKYPKEVLGVILLDATPFGTKRFKEELSSEANRMADKAAMLPILKVLGTLGLMPLFKASFSYIPIHLRSLMIKNYSNPRIYKSVLEEFAYLEKSILQVRSASEFPNIPMIVVNHDRKVHLDIAAKRGVRESEAIKCEELWDETYKEYLELSPQSEWVIAKNSSHGIDMDRPDLVINLTKKLINKFKVNI